MVVLIWLPVVLLFVAGWLLGIPVPDWLLNGTAVGAFVATFAVGIRMALQRAAESPETPEERSAWWRAIW